MTEMGNINDSEQAMEAETAPAAFQRQMGRGLSEVPALSLFGRYSGAFIRGGWLCLAQIIRNYEFGRRGGD